MTSPESVNLESSGRSRHLLFGGRILALTLLLLPATYPLWQQGMQATHDGIHHLARLFELDTMMRAGVWYPRWFSDMGFLYGFPVLHYYGAFIYYLAEAFRFFGAGYIAAEEWVLGLGLVASGWTMYAFVRRWNEPAAWLAALAYVYWPYHLANAHVRGAQAELWAMVWYPLLLAQVHQLLRPDATDRWRGGLLLALGYALLIFTHNISAVMFTPVLILYALWLALISGRGQRLAGVAGALCLGAALSAFFWLPALADVGWVRAPELRAAAAAEYVDRIFPLAGLISPFWMHRYLPDQGAAIFHPLARVTILFGVAGIVLMLAAWGHTDRDVRRSWLFFVGLTLAAVFMMHSRSRFLWAGVPGLSLLGPPYRFQGLVALGGSLTFALGVEGGMRWFWEEKVGGGDLGRLLLYPLYGLIVLWLPASSLPRLPQVAMTIPGSEQILRDADIHRGTLAQFDYQIGLAAREWGGAWFFEYLPVWMNEDPTTFFLPPDRPPSPGPPLDVRVELQAYEPLAQTYRVRGFVPWTFTLHQFYFPAWQVELDGRPLKPYPRGTLGLLAADIPAGEHIIQVRYGSTSSQRAGILLAIVAVLLWLWLAARRFPRMFATVLILALILIVLLLTLSPPSPFARSAFRPQDTRVGNEIRLLAGTLPQTRYRPGDRVWIALDWLALTAPQERYKVLLHLEDTGGTQWANGDTEPGFYFTPTTRWLPGEIMRDWYSVVIPPDAPAGVYRLLTGMYRPDTLENLPLKGGEHIGGRLLIGEITVEAQ